MFDGKETCEMVLYYRETLTEWTSSSICFIVI